ncbi:MAG: bifunctional folylpolyglutamate synthase/dihydrofolate synthase, partial [Flavobacteriaceae bacterium]|nr:bifunctional folylpolyglutamate synthase/dihydrofolate synthase [Flavobacteriaceae bacterium]
SVITNIGLDHTQFLGETLAEIAFEKAGIIKFGIPVVIGEKQKETSPVFEKIANKNQTKIYYAEKNVLGDYKTDLLGDYQKKNVKTAVMALHILDKETKIQISDKVIKIGLQNIVANTGLKGRYQILYSNPKVICDTAHNKEGLHLVLDQIQKEEFNALHIVLGVVNDKNLDNILPLFPKDANYYFCKPNIPRGKNEKELQQVALKFGLNGDAYDSVILAYQSALKDAGSDDLVYAGGSTFVVAELPI